MPLHPTLAFGKLTFDEVSIHLRLAGMRNSPQQLRHVTPFLLKRDLLKPPCPEICPP